jgi:FG-GAP-like repeat/FG-GAP repeat
VGTVDSIQSVATPPGFTAVSSGDFNGDGFSDILLKDSSGDVQVDLMRGSTVESSAAFATNNLTAIGTGDFNGDGNSDILFTNAAGKAVIWTMNGTTKTGAFAAQDKPGAGYTLVGTADINGDGISDLLWQNGTNVYVTLENGSGGAMAGSGPINGIVPANSYHLIASSGGG